MPINLDDPRTWGGYKYGIIAHDVGRTRDRSTAVYGGLCPWRQGLIGVSGFSELPHGFGTQLANELAQVDRAHGGKNLIVPDLSFDASYGEILNNVFRGRLVGAQIGAHGDGMDCDVRSIIGGSIPVYPIGRTYLLQHLLTAMESGWVKFADSPECRRAYSQLADLEVEIKETGVRYRCPTGQHDDLAISIAMLVWFARHPHLPSWFRNIERMHTPKQRRPAPSAKGWT